MVVFCRRVDLGIVSVGEWALCESREVAITSRWPRNESLIREAEGMPLEMPSDALDILGCSRVA